MKTRKERRVADVPITMRANDPFGRYGPMGSHEVRQADVTGQSFAERVKRTREMLRSLEPEKARDIIEFRGDLNLFQALALAKREGKLIVPNDVHDRILTETKDMKLLKQLYGAWVRTGTLVIYEKPDKPFGKKVNSGWEDNNNLKYSISFQVPKQFRGKVNCALVIEHPDFELISLGNNKYEIKTIDDSNIYLVQNFAKINCCWHLTEHGIPVGEEVDRSTNDSRYLLRGDIAYLGPVARVCGYIGVVSWRDVDLNDGPSNRYGVAFVDVGRPEV